MNRLVFSVLLSGGCFAVEPTWDIKDIPIRDPFIYVDKASLNYYMYAQNANRGGDSDTALVGVEVYQSKDLKHWTSPKQVLTVPKNSWAKKWVWAPEVFRQNNQYFLFVTLTSEEKHQQMVQPIKGGGKWPEFHKRGTQIFVADSPAGPFKPFSNSPHTAKNVMALDGTLFVEDGKNYMIYCHEWVEVGDGSVELIELTNDFSATKGGATQLFRASDAKWSKPMSNGGRVTDGVYLHTTQTGKLVMIWSSFGEQGYAVGQAISTTGSIKGPWLQVAKPLFSKNGGHGMLFETLEGQLMLALHQPNNPSGAERLHLFKIDDSGDQLSMSQ